MPPGWLDRLAAQIRASSSPILWLRGLPGTGKSTLLAHVRPWAEESFLICDEPAADMLTQFTPGERRLLLAARPSAATDRALLRWRPYGAVEVIGDHALFLTEAECAAWGDGILFQRTGGWPFLVGAYLDRRSETIQDLLPAFLDTELFPSLPHALVVAILAASDTPLPLSATHALFGDAALHPLLAATPDGVVLAADWVKDAVQRLKQRPTVWQRATSDAVVQIHARHGKPVPAIEALNRMGQREAALDLFDQAGGFRLGLRDGVGLLCRALDSFPAGLEDRVDTLLFARILVMVASGRGAAALAKLQARYPGLPVDLRQMRYSHRPYAILFRLLLEADAGGSAPIESWGQLAPLLDPDDRAGRALLDHIMRIGASTQGVSLVDADLSALAAEHRLVHAQHALDRGALAQARELMIPADRSSIAAALRLQLDYETGIEIDPRAAESVINSLTLGPSWPAVFRATLKAGSLGMLRSAGLTQALDYLARGAALLRQRHCLIDQHPVALLRIQLLQIARRHDEANAALAALQQGNSTEEALIRARVRLVARNVAPIDLERETHPRHRIAWTILSGYQQLRAGEAAASRRAIAQALHDADATSLAAPLIEESEFLERPLQNLLAEARSLPLSTRHLADAAALLLRTLPFTSLHAKAAGGLSRQEHRVLLHLSDGNSNKEIARALSVSESAVKFHLRNLFQKFNVDARNRLIDAARERGLVR
jgi:DNA-binding CsgD family transcriptional regulator